MVTRCSSGHLDELEIRGGSWETLCILLKGEDWKETAASAHPSSSCLDLGPDGWSYGSHLATMKMIQWEPNMLLVEWQLRERLGPL